jgi:hypothetical protein
MFDELDMLRQAKDLLYLLGHYAERARPDRQAWQDRVAEQQGLSPRDLVKLHGELLAYGWIEQNTGTCPVLAPGQVPQCYRVTAAGLRALKQLREEVGGAA